MDDFDKTLLVRYRKHYRTATILLYAAIAAVLPLSLMAIGAAIVLVGHLRIGWLVAAPIAVLAGAVANRQSAARRLAMFEQGVEPNDHEISW